MYTDYTYICVCAFCICNSNVLCLQCLEQEIMKKKKLKIKCMNKYIYMFIIDEKKYHL